jgi:lipid II:glycine glycyltransferase (peptidoglycan interpeptide bridge formation enzyme)
LVRLGIGQGGLDDESLDLGLREVVKYARQDKSVLRVTADSFSVEPDWLMRTGDALRLNGFRLTAPKRTYARTLLLDLEPSEEELMAGLHKSARRNIRDATKFPVVVESAESESLAERLQDLDDETRLRTGGAIREMDWKSMIAMTARNPHLSRISVLRRTDREGPEAILAYAWCCMQGDVAQYSEAGSTRVEDLKVSTSYVLLWDLICWGRRNGAHYFDLGGVTGGAEGTADPLGGISDFKRRFSPFEFEVGQEWTFEPHPARAATARAISRGAGLLRSAVRSIRARRG